MGACHPHTRPCILSRYELAWPKDRHWVGVLGAREGEGESQARAVSEARHS